MDDPLIVDLLYAQIVSDVYGASVRIGSRDTASVKALLGE